MKAYDGSTIYEHSGDEDPNPYQVEHDRLFAAIEEGRVINDGEHGAKSTMTAILGRMATYSGEVIKWDDALACDKRLVPDPADWSWDAMPPSVPDVKGNYAIPVPGVTKVL